MERGEEMKEKEYGEWNVLPGAAEFYFEVAYIFRDVDVRKHFLCLWGALFAELGRGLENERFREDRDRK